MSSAHSPNFPSLHLHHSSFSNPTVALPTSQLILQPFCCFTYLTVHSPTIFCFSYVTSSSLMSPGKPPMVTDSIQNIHLNFFFSLQLQMNLISKHFSFSYPLLPPSSSSSPSSGSTDVDNVKTSMLMQ